jgi:hypothetical protein
VKEMRKERKEEKKQNSVMYIVCVLFELPNPSISLLHPHASLPQSNNKHTIMMIIQ